MGPKSCSRPSTCQPCMLPSKLSFPSTLLDVPLVLSWTLVMVYPTPSPSMKVMLSPTPSSVWTWLAVSSPTTSWRSSPREATLSPPLPSVKLSVTSRRNSAMLPLTSNKKWQLPLPPPPWRNPMNCPMAKLSPLAMNVSVPQKPYSSHLSWEWNPAVSMRPPITPSLSSRSLLHPRENTPYGSEDPSWLLFPPSNRCGSPSKNTTSAAHPLSTTYNHHLQPPPTTTTYSHHLLPPPTTTTYNHHLDGVNPLVQTPSTPPPFSPPSPS